MQTILLVAGGSFAGLLLGAALLHLLGAMGNTGRAIGDVLARAPMLDLVITYFTVLPPIVGACVVGWLGVVGAILGQVLALLIWCWLHELAHPAARKGPRIVKEINRLVGRTRNHGALWITTLAVPAFWLLRLTELVVYPFLVWLVRFPRYKQSEWVNVSRYKFEGLVGHDLIWCLYCDWMTGIWSLGSEMLRNLESFWCPIRFYDGKKCENCVIDFPDIDNGWVPADASMADVTKLLTEQYTADDSRNAWYGHPARLTIEGNQIEPKES